MNSTSRLLKAAPICTLILFFCGITSLAQTEVEAYHPGVTANGITYFLPTTKLQIVVTAKRTIYKPGEYAQYAALYLRTDNAIQDEHSIWEITGLKATAYGAANKDHAYSIKLKPRTVAPLVGLAPDGRLLSINTAAPELPTLELPSVTQVRADKENGADFKTQEILSAASRTKMAELTAAEIYDIRENRSLLAKGQADFMPKDGEQLRLMLESLEEQENGLLSLFKGTTREEVHVFTFDYTPTDEVKNELLFRFSRHFGILDDDDVGGTPYTISVSNDRSLPEVVIPEKPKKEKKPVEDVRYVIPGSATITIANPTSEILKFHTPLAQFGHVEHLGGELFHKNSTIKLTFSEATGGIISITN